MITELSIEHINQVKPWLIESEFRQHLATVYDRGFIVIPGVLSEAECDKYAAILQEHMASSPMGRNVFEGTSSHRLYALLAKSGEFSDLITHPLSLAFAEHFLGESCLLSACLSINLHPGETVQPWHTDDGHISVPQPHDVFGVSTFWCFDDTTELNGATEVLPYSHQWASHEIQGRLEDQHFGEKANPEVEASANHPDAVKVVMPRGSLMIARSDLWHRGGANLSDRDRLIVTPQYCAGWARPLETMFLAIPPETVKGLPARTQELLGYSIHAPFMGYVNGMHPSRVLQ